MKGFTLIEMIIFIAVLAIVGVSLLVGINQVARLSGQSATAAVGGELAASRMEIILGWRKTFGFTGLTDPCTLATPPNVCNLPATLGSYTITSSLTPTTINGDDRYLTITVTTSLGTRPLARLTTLVADY